MNNESKLDTIEISIIMPCLNEKETLEICILKAKKFIHDHKIRGEIIIADNGSQDGSQDIAINAGVKLVHIPTRGYGAALAGGMSTAQGHYLIMGDADDSYDFESLMPFITALKNGADLVIGNRFQGGIEKGAMPFLHRYVGNPILTGLGRFFFSVPVGDFHCGLRAIRKDRLLHLNLQTSGMEYASEMIVRAALNGLKIEQVPTTLKKDGRSRRSHLRTWRDGWRHLSFLLMYSPKWLFFYPGLALIAAGAAFSLLLYPHSIKIGNISFDVHTFIVMCFLFLIGTQAISFALLVRQYGASKGFLPQNAFNVKISKFLKLEHILLFAVPIFIVGFLGLISCLFFWISIGFGPIEYAMILRRLVFSMTAISLSMQLTFTGFLYSILTMPTITLPFKGLNKSEK